MAVNMKCSALQINVERASSGRLSWIRQTAGVMAVAGLAVGAGYAQIPRYRSPIEAPTPKLSLPAAPAAISPNGTVVAYPIVRVNDQIINNSDYERTQKQTLAEAQQQNLSPTELQDRQKNLLRDMIDQQLLLSRGKELDINADAEVIRRLDDIRKQNHLDSMEALEKAVREQGISYEDWKQSIKNSVITQQVVRDEVARTIRLTPRDEQTYYEAHKQEFTSPERVHLSEILIPTPDNATDAQVEQAKAKAEEVAAKLKDGGNFEALAKQYSGGPNADSGGDLGDFKRGDLGKVLEDAVFPLKPGENTAPIRTRQGYVVLKVTDHQQAGIQPLKAVEDQVQQAMYEEAIQPALRAYLTKLRENAYVDVAPGFVDTGASPKQTKPVFQGAAPLPTKKKNKSKARMDERAAAAAPAGKAPDGAKPAVTPKPASTLMANGKKKIHREKIRFGHAPQTALPEAEGETLTAGADQGAGATSVSQAAPGSAVGAPAPANDEAAKVDLTAAPAAPQKKTRYTDRQATMEQDNAAKKVKKAKSKAAAVAPKPTADEATEEKAQTAPLGLNGDTASKKKKQKVKDAPKERIQQKAPEPPKPAPEPTPIPPRSVRQSGEPAVTPINPATTANSGTAPAGSESAAPTSLPPGSATPPGAAVDTSPSTPQNPAPTPPQQ